MKFSSSHLLNSWRATVLLSVVCIASVACGSGKTDSAADSVGLDISGQPPRLLSAFFGLDNGLPFGANRLCLGASGKDGMPVVLSHTIDPETLQAEDFRIVRRSGAESTPMCVTLRPSNDAGELRTVLLIGEFGDADKDPPTKVVVVDDLISDGKVGEKVNFRSAQTQVIPLDAGPMLVWAGIVPENIWSQSGRGSACPTSTQQVVRATWAGGIRLPNGGEPGDAERALYRVTVTHPDGSKEEVAPASLADLGDNDNNHLLCLDTTVPATAVAFPAGHLVDPNGDLNPDSQIAVVGAAETRESEASVATPAADGRPAHSYDAKPPLPEASFNARAEQAASRRAYFGDLHVHTTYSLDAFQFGTLATPDDAYRFARGEAIKHPAGFDMQLDRPLDFYAVTDHGFYLGVVRAGADTTTEISTYPAMESIHNLNAAENLTLESVPLRDFRAWIRGFTVAMGGSEPLRAEVESIMRTTWADVVRAADRHYEPGEFTTFAAYEFSTTKEDGGSMHRNVVFRGTGNMPAMPFDRNMSRDPEDLWNWMDGLRKKGVESLAIPHNSNKSNGQMFERATWAGDPMTPAHNEKRIRNEPLVEITQVKGTSETHPALSMNDEWAGFEIDPYVAGGGPLTIAKTAGGYVRDAMKKGLLLEAHGLGNPFEFGFIGSSDTHTGAGSYDETNFFSKVGLLDSTPALRGSVPLSDDDLNTLALSDAEDSVFYVASDGRRYLSSNASVYGASGLAAVWAEENTRESIYDALRRKETFATSGPRIRVRFFAGHGLDSTMLETADGISRAYVQGVSMGGDLVASPRDAPAFIVWAARDAQSAPLQRVQIIKGWLEDGETHERIFDVACSDGLEVDPTTHRCPDNGARVNLSDCAISADRGAAELKTLWRDPEFDEKQKAFYYARVLENPTCRWSTWDALRAGVAPRGDLERVIQERAWSSPIWVSPHGG